MKTPKRDLLTSYQENPVSLTNVKVDRRGSDLSSQLLEVFKSQLQLEKRIERVKIDLSLRTDFNLIDTFRIFDTQGKGWVTPEEIRAGLTSNVFNLAVSSRDIALYMSRYDRDRDGRLRYSEFCDSFLPIDPFHASLLAKKAPLLGGSSLQTLRQELLFYPETRETLIACWRLHFENEREAERLRSHINGSIPRLDLYQCFQEIDSKSDGYIDTQEVILNSSNIAIAQGPVPSSRGIRLGEGDMRAHRQV
jgi:Ca2+-binding EF-hand superfamily protein